MVILGVGWYRGSGYIEIGRYRFSGYIGGR